MIVGSVKTRYGDEVQVEIGEGGEVALTVDNSGQRFGSDMDAATADDLTIEEVERIRDLLNMVLEEASG